MRAKQTMGFYKWRRVTRMKTIRTLALLPVTIVIFALAWGAILMGSGGKTALAASPDGLHLDNPK
jgi:hypothetical protein